MEKIVHNIKAHLYDNVLTEDPNDFIARVSSEKSLNVKQVCQSASLRGKADTNPDTMEHLVNQFLREMTYLLCDGFSINTGTFYVSPHIKGTFNTTDEKFNPEKHRVIFEFQQGAGLRKEATEVQVDILGAADVGLYIAQVLDVKSGSINEYITPRYNLKIRGDKLKIIGENEQIGVYITSLTDGTEMKIDPTDIVSNMPKEVVILLPTLAEGQYQIKLCTQYSPGKNLKEPRTTTFNKILTVI